MKIAHLTTVDMSLRFLLLPQLLAAREHGESIGISAPGPYVEELEAQGIRHIPLPSSTRGISVVADVKAMRQLWRALRTERPDVLHTHNPKPGLYGRILGRLAGIPVVVNTVHGLYATPDSPLLKRVAVYGLEAVASRFSDAELVQSREDLQLIERKRLAPRGHARYLGNGVDLTRFDPSRFTEEDRLSQRAQLGLAPDVILVGMVGRLVAEKGFLDLFEAASLLGAGYRVVCVGPDDPEKGDALDPAAVAEARGRGILFTGLRTDVERLYNAMDILVLPSHREGFPRAAMEASAMGLPIIATDIRGCREVVDHGETGLLIPVRNPRRLAEAITMLGQDARLRKRLAEGAAAKARDSFDESRIVATVMDTYREISNRKLSSRRNNKPRVGYALGKRLLDVFGALLGLVVLSPVMAFAALLIRITMGRPVLYVQTRPGLHQRPFRLYKFRTMRPLEPGEQPGESDGRRMTPVGNWLRRTSIDELPQLVNVLKGDMSLVGPRPLLTQYLELYSPVQNRRHVAKPGITGWAQINGRNAPTWEERLAMDVWYVDNRSTRLDLSILAKTLARAISGRGVSQEGEATVQYFEGSGEQANE